MKKERRCIISRRRKAAARFFTLNIALLICLCCAGEVSGQGNFFPAGKRGTGDGVYYSALRDGKVVKVEYLTGGVTDTLADLSGRGIQSHILSPDGTKALLVSGRAPIYRRSYTADYSVADLATGEVTPVSISAIPGMRDASFSPDGSLVAFVRGNNLFVTAPGSLAETHVTRDGERNHIINGATDWVYEEEYAFTRAYEFSPDSRRIAYLRFDESPVREFSMMRYDGKLYPEPYIYKYPKAGEKNSIVTLHVYDIDTGRTVQVDTGTETDQYIPRIGWTPAGDLYFYRVNRLQNRFEVVLSPDGGAETKVIYDESSPRYVERPDDETVTFLADGDRFIVMNETRTGWMHLYLYSIDKGFLNAITSGEWEVTELLGERDGKVWYVSTEPSPLERHMYSVRLNGKGKKRLTEGEGTYMIDPAPDMRYYTSRFYDARHREPVVERVATDTPALKWRSDNARTPLPTAAEFFTFTTDGGTVLNGYLLKPDGFDPTKQYPLFMTQYSGPGSQSVAKSSRDVWDGSLYPPLLEAGYVIACVDGRGTGFRGEEFKKCTYGQLGRLETDDQIAAARYLGSLGYIDASRIGIYGWSYGGFMALNCILKGNDVFKLAVAVAPVTSWRYYDTIYTEIYNGLPQENPSGYDDNSPINFADRLKGRLLLMHGTGDDNVHVQNSYEMAKALVAAGKEFDMMVYPDDNHSMRPNGAHHIRRKIVDYVMDNL